MLYVGKYISILSIFLSNSLFGQYNNPENGEIFDDSEIARLDVYISQDSLNVILKPGNEQSDNEYPATAIIRIGSNIDTLNNIGFRLRGFTSRYHAKKSFKISVNAFEKGHHYKGLEKLNLSGQQNDPTIIRSKLGWDLMKDVGALASRINHLEFYINDEYKGLYNHVEHIDEEYIQKRFKRKVGNLYKCSSPADLTYLGENPNNYKMVNPNKFIIGNDTLQRPIYELKTNEEVGDYSLLARFISILNNSTNEEFQKRLETVFHVPSYLKSLATEMLIGHLDNHSISANNYYLYENTVDNKIYYIPYDLDNTFGISLIGPIAEYNVYDWFSKTDERPIKRILKIPRYRALYTDILIDLLDNHFNPNILFPKIDSLKSMIQQSAESDLYRTYDWGYTVADFNESYKHRISQDFVLYGLKEYIQRRYDSAKKQLAELLIEKADLSVFIVYPNPSSKVFNIDFITMAPGIKMIEIYNIYGEKIFSDETISAIYEWNSKNNKNQSISKGTYLLTVLDNSGNRQTKRIVIN